MGSDSEDDSENDLFLPLQEFYREQAYAALVATKPNNFIWKENDSAYIQNFMIERGLFNIGNKKPFHELCKLFGIKVKKSYADDVGDDDDDGSVVHEDKRVNEYMLDKLRIKVSTIATNLFRKGKIVALRSPDREGSRYRLVGDQKETVIKNLAAALKSAERYPSISIPLVKEWVTDMEEAG